MNLEKVCSYCRKEDPTVDRNMFDGLCADCTDLSISYDNVSGFAQEANEKLKNGMIPYECPCESTRMMSNCNNKTCDGIFYYTKD